MHRIPFVSCVSSRSVSNIALFTIILFTALFLISDDVTADSGFPVTSSLLGGDGGHGSPGLTGTGGAGGTAGIPSGLESERDGGYGGNGGDGGNGGNGGNGGSGIWSIAGNIIVNGYIVLGGVNGTDNDHFGSPGLDGGIGGSGGFANFNAFSPGHDGTCPDGSIGGLGSTETTVNGADGEFPGCGAGGGSSGPWGFTQYMSNGGLGMAGEGGTGIDGSHGGFGGNEEVTTNSDLTISGGLRLGGHGGNGAPAADGGDAGGGGGGAGGGGGWSSGLGGWKGFSGAGGSPGTKGFSSFGQIKVLNNGSFTSNGGTLIKDGNIHVEAGGTFFSNGNISIQFGYINLHSSGTFFCNSTSEINGNGQISGNGDFQNNGIISVPVSHTGNLSGVGRFSGFVNYSGTMSPGNELNNGLGTLHFGSIAIGGIVLHTQLAGTTGNQYDILEAKSLKFHTSHNNTVLPEFSNGLTEADLSEGDFFDIIRYNSSNLNPTMNIDSSLAPLTQGRWELEYGHEPGGSDIRYSVRLIYHSDLSPAPDPGLPLSFALKNIYPNPFNPQTKVNYELPMDCTVSFRIFDVSGCQVWQQSKIMPAGRHELTWNGTDNSGRSLPSGTYLLRMQTGSFQDTRRMVLVR